MSWMVSDLNLSGNELLIFALIYGFCQDGDSEFYGSRRYIADMFNISLPTVDKAIKNLISKQFIIKQHLNINNVSYNTYKVSLPPIKNREEKDFPGGKEPLPNNKNTINNKIINTNKNNTNTNVLVEKPKRQNKYEMCLDLIYQFTNNFELQQVLINYLRMRLEIKDKPLYKNSWKGLLNKLDKLSTDANEQIEIVQRSTDRGYASFYEIKDKKSVDKKPWNDNVRSQSYTEDELEELEEEEKKLNAKGIKTRF